MYKVILKLIEESLKEKKEVSVFLGGQKRKNAHIEAWLMALGDSSLELSDDDRRDIVDSLKLLQEKSGHNEGDVICFFFIEAIQVHEQILFKKPKEGDFLPLQR